MSWAVMEGSLTTSCRVGVGPRRTESRADPHESRLSGVARRRRGTDVLKVPGTKSDIAAAIKAQRRESMSSTCLALEDIGERQLIRMVLAPHVTFQVPGT